MIETKKTLEELLNHIEENLNVIYVRDYKNGKVGSWSLVELPIEQAIKHIFGWIRNYEEKEL